VDETSAANGERTLAADVRECHLSPSLGPFFVLRIVERVKAAQSLLEAVSSNCTAGEVP
jgi:hypothetical protein